MTHFHQYSFVNVSFSESVSDLVIKYLKSGNKSEREYCLSWAMHLGPTQGDADSRFLWLEGSFARFVPREFILASERRYLDLEEVRRGMNVLAWVNFGDSMECANFAYWIDRCGIDDLFVACPDLGGGAMLGYGSVTQNEIMDTNADPYCPTDTSTTRSYR